MKSVKLFITGCMLLAACTLVNAEATSEKAPLEENKGGEKSVFIRTNHDSGEADIGGNSNKNSVTIGGNWQVSSKLRLGISGYAGKQTWAEPFYWMTGRLGWTYTGDEERPFVYGTIYRAHPRLRHDTFVGGTVTAAYALTDRLIADTKVGLGESYSNIRRFSGPRRSVSAGLTYTF